MVPILQDPVDSEMPLEIWWERAQTNSRKLQVKIQKLHKQKEGKEKKKLAYFLNHHEFYKVDSRSILSCIYSHHVSTSSLSFAILLQIFCTSSISKCFSSIIEKKIKLILSKCIKIRNFGLKLQIRIPGP